ncbi:putative N-acetyltransferase YhbS [Rheinheimera pacifica]|uniref:GNAT family N-acetyltransferase n=1 Tax=Rheinheimera pacifica TaxID=173990 RepID=UPI000CCAACAE|nr:GNAT family N-acetyltransferase [Rheinheimera pacifica]MDR6982843.1 putative N-acetyltransferase YhbS [Rheinheimera pacifica]PKM20128.1 MAG: GNAT family N-acetyltransferase [Gammaproteobacteria bacterium HGW-Gammaproteobacteria-15]
MSFDLVAPQPLTVNHQLDSFSCGETELDNWLKRRAMANQLRGASRTFVVTDRQNTVLGYYALAAGAVALRAASANVHRNMPDPLPVLVLARLAVDTRAQGMKVGAGLLQDAVQRAVNVSQNTGVRALLVHALHEQGKGFYEYYGFQPSPVNPMVLMLRLSNARP